MKDKLVKLSKSPFVRNVAIVVTGTAAAQAIAMAFAPLITRIYGPEAFGVLGVFKAMLAIVAPIAALTYPIAIVLPKNDSDAKGLIRLSLYVSGLMAAIVSFILVFFNKQIVDLLQVEIIAPFLYLIPLVILFSAFLQVMQQWLIRTKQFKIIARTAFLQALLLNSAKLGIGWFNPIASVLVILATLGNALHALMLFLGARVSQYKQDDSLYQNESNAMRNIGKRYKDFPMFRAPQVFMNAISQSMPVLLLASFFGPASAGFYSLARQILGLPFTLIAKSVGDVFYPKIAEAAHSGQGLTRLIIKATLALVAVGIIPFGIIIAFGPWLFGFVFGSDWVLAGQYAKWLAVWLFFMFINRPSAMAIPVLSMQKGFLIYEIFSILFKIVALLTGFYLFEDDILTVAFYSITGVIMYVYLIIWVIKSSKASNISEH